MNVTDKETPLELGLEGFKAAPKGRCWKLKSTAGLDGQNAIGKAPEVVIAEDTFDATQKVLTAAPYSIVLYRFEAV